MLGTRYESKEIKIEGHLICTSESELRTYLIALKKALDTDEANLDIDDDDNPTVLRYIATVSDINIPEEHYYISDVPYSITFIAQPYGKATTTSLITNSITTSTDTITVVLTGSAGSKPLLNYINTSTPSSAITSVTVRNTTTSESITVTGLALDGKNEYLEIDCDAMTVKKYEATTLTNSDFSGMFPSFKPGTNSIYVTLVGGGASINLKQSVTYYPYYL